MEVRLNMITVKMWFELELFLGSLLLYISKRTIQRTAISIFPFVYLVHVNKYSSLYLVSKLVVLVVGRS